MGSDAGASGSAPVLTERRGRTLVVTLNRPEVRNAVDVALARALAGALDDLDSDPDLSTGILTGAGKGFCAGMDLKAFMAGGEPVAGDRGFAGIVQRPPRKPMVAAIEGFALAGGLEVALACDLIVAGRGAILGLPEVKRGLVASGGGLLRLPRRVPMGLAAELALTGEPISAERAYEIGLVNRLVPAGEALAEALRVAESIGTAGPLAVNATKRILAEQAGWPEEELWSRQADIVGPVEASEDAAEGSRAFAEKRPPVWRGR